MACEVEAGPVPGDDPGATGGDRFRVLVTAGYFEPGWRAGGPVRSLAEMLDAAGPEVEVTLITRDHDLGDPVPYPGLSGRFVPRGRHRVFYLAPRRLAHWRTLRRGLRGVRYDLLYVNSVWSPLSILAVVAARLRLVRAGHLLLTPRGELGAGALGLKRTRKRLFWAVWRQALRGRRTIWHATTPLEAADIRRALPGARVAVVAENDGPAPTDPPAGPGPAGPARLVFIGRISAMKNVDLILRALALVGGEVEFDLYGPCENAGYWERCRNLLTELPANVVAVHRGALPPERVRGVFARYDAFVLPTRGENFGHVIAESLSVACPVICSDRTPWTEVLRGGGGAVLPDLTPQALAELIDRVAAASPAQRHQARLAAAAAYRRWRDHVVDQASVLDQARAVVRTVPTVPAAR
ncbi:glycosyltransferase [Micromonospora sp. NPDC092111]|uniref:glycosyltransferase n=1 Tax=Micromonospora sp. NPDC092111 TaxID=3364289 RepID=UPI0037FB6101